MKGLLNTCLLLALFHTVASLTCYQCVGQKAACNTPITTECSDNEDVCVYVTYGLTVGVSSLADMIVKTCAESEFWHTDNYIFTTDYITLSANMHTCTTDLCNDKDIPMPSRSGLEPNGRKCPACFSFDSDRCQIDDVISCRGNETVCVDFGIKASEPGDVEIPIGAQGCATKNYCDYATGEMETIGGFVSSTFTHLKCNEAPLSESAVGGSIRGPHRLWSLPFMGMKRRGQKRSSSNIEDEELTIPRSSS